MTPEIVMNWRDAAMFNSVYTAPFDGQLFVTKPFDKDYAELSPFFEDNPWKIRFDGRWFHVYLGTVRKTSANNIQSAMSFVKDQQ